MPATADASSPPAPSVWFAVSAGLFAIPGSIFVPRGLAPDDLLYLTILLLFYGVVPTIWAAVLGRFGAATVLYASSGTLKAAGIGLGIALAAGALSIVTVLLFAIPFLHTWVLHYRAVSGMVVNFIMAAPLYGCWGAVAGIALRASAQRNTGFKA